jgi:hypothetical protein
MRSNRNGCGLALIRIESVVAGKRLVAGDVTIVPVKPDWMRLDSSGNG